MSLEDLTERLYHWSLQEADRELGRNLRLVKTVRGDNAEKYVRYFQQLPPSEAPVASQALVKRMNQPVLLRQKKTQLSDLEGKYVQAYLQFEQVGGSGGLTIVRAEQPTVKWTLELRKTLRALVKERFRAEAGTFEPLDANEWIHEVDIDSVRVNTWLDFGGRSAMSYSHRLSLSDGTRLEGHISVLQWLGAASMTRWRALRAEELLDAADAVLALCQHFVAEMKTLFSQ